MLRKEVGDRVQKRCDDFVAKHKRRWTDEDLEKDCEWKEDMQLYKKLKRDASEALALSAAEADRPNGCRHFISRKGRFCSNMASSESEHGYCTLHDQAAAPTNHDEDAVTIPSTGDAESKKKKNLARTPKYMLNPFKIKEAEPAPNWHDILQDASRPMLVDIGCAKGRFVARLASGKEARLTKDGVPFNYCGVELYAPLVEVANKALPKGKGNLHYVSANILTSVKSLNFPNLHTVSIQFPDPWIKKASRRTVTPQLANDLADVLPKGGQVYLCSDYLELAVDMRSIMLGTGRYEPAQGTTCHVEIVGKGAGGDGGGRGGEEEAGVGEAGVGVPTGVPSAVAWGGLTHERARMKWLPRRPYFVGTERDQVCELKWRPSYRVLLTKK